MRTSSLVLIVLAVVLGASLLSIRFSPSVQDFMAANTLWNGLRDFTQEFQVRHIDSLAELPESGPGVLIALPCTPYDRDDLERVRQYVSRGNTLVLMDDFGSGNQVLEYLGLPARFNRDLLLDPLFCYQNPRLPRITDFSPELREQGVRAVVFNHGTCLDGVEDSAALAWSSPKSFADRDGSGKLDSGETGGPLMVAAEYRLGEGTVRVVADSSLIINTMVSQNDNYAFVRYLVYRGGTPEAVLLDRSHLSLTPLDTGKNSLEAARQFVSHPLVLLLVVAFIFVLAARYTLKKEEFIG